MAVGAGAAGRASLYTSGTRCHSSMEQPATESLPPSLPCQDVPRGANIYNKDSFPQALLIFPDSSAQGADPSSPGHGVTEKPLCHEHIFLQAWSKTCLVTACLVGEVIVGPGQGPIREAIQHAIQHALSPTGFPGAPELGGWEWRVQGEDTDLLNP